MKIGFSQVHSGYEASLSSNRNKRRQKDRKRQRERREKKEFTFVAAAGFDCLVLTYRGNDPEFELRRHKSLGYPLQTFLAERHGFHKHRWKVYWKPSSRNQLSKAHSSKKTSCPYRSFRRKMALPLLFSLFFSLLSSLSLSSSLLLLLSRTSLDGNFVFFF